MVEQLLVETVSLARTPVLNELMLPVTFFGSMVFVLVLAAAIRIFDRVLSDRIVSGSIAAYAVAHVIKLVVRRPRPPVERLVEVSTYSFPSGHTAVAFAVAAVLEDRTDLYRFYLLALAVGVSRIYLGVHYPSDVLAGAAIGYLAGRYTGAAVAKVKNFTHQLR